jgi:cytochrome P450
MKSLPTPVGLYDPFVHTVMDDPYPIYRRLRNEYPVFHNQDRDLWVLSRYSDVQSVARNWEVFSSASGADIDVGFGFFGAGDFGDSDPPKHDRIRGVLRDAFTPRRVQDLEDKIRRQVEELFAPLFERGSGEFVEEVGSQLPLAIIFGMLGYRDDGAFLAPLMYDALARVPGSSLIPERATQAVQALKDYAETVAEERRKRPQDDLVSVIVAAEKTGDIVREEVPAICILLMLAGWNTTTALVANSMWLLAHHPDQRRLLAEAPDRIPGAIEEILRCESPAQHHTRVLTKEMELHGHTIAAGERVLLLWASANRDEERWVDGETFDVAREPKRNLAFGEGIHHCIGAPLARLEGRILVEYVLSRAPDFEVGETERFPGVMLRGIARLPISL